MNPDSTISAIRPSMIALVSTTMCGSPAASSVSSAGARPADEADRLGGEQQVLALGDGQAEHPEPEEQRHARAAATSRAAPRTPTAADRAAGPSAARAAARRRPSRTRRSTARWTARKSHVAGTTVRYGRIAKPTTSQAAIQAISQMPPLGVTSTPPAGVTTSSPAGLASAEPDQAAERDAEQADVADHDSLGSYHSRDRPVT